MAQTDDPRDGEAQEANTNLSEGLKSCRAVVSNYRELLKKGQTPPDRDHTPPTE